MVDFIVPGGDDSDEEEEEEYDSLSDTSEEIDTDKSPDWLPKTRSELALSPSTSESAAGTSSVATAPTSSISETPQTPSAASSSSISETLQTPSTASSCSTALSVTSATLNSGSIQSTTRKKKLKNRGTQCQRDRKNNKIISDCYYDYLITLLILLVLKYTLLFVLTIFIISK